MTIGQSKEIIKKINYDLDTGKIKLDLETKEALFMALVALEKYEKIRAVVLRQEFQIQQGFNRGQTSAYMKIKKIIYGEGVDDQ